MTLSVSLDTSFLITYADDTREHHAVAVQYVQACMTSNIPMFVSAIAIAEYEVKQQFADIQQGRFLPVNYNAMHAIKSAELYRKYKNIVRDAVRNPANEVIPHERNVIINDFNIVGQAEEEGITYILTDDSKTMEKMVNCLHINQHCNIRSIALYRGYDNASLYEHEFNLFSTHLRE
jgi:predicted nucleic acid-binding protein